MNDHGEYEVIGPFGYRHHEPGERFVAKLGHDGEGRAIRFGIIRLIGVLVPSVTECEYRLPKGWLP